MCTFYQISYCVIILLFYKHFEYDMYITYYLLYNRHQLTMVTLITYINDYIIQETKNEIMLIQIIYYVQVSIIHNIMATIYSEFLYQLELSLFTL